MKHYLLAVLATRKFASSACLVQVSWSAASGFKLRRRLESLAPDFSTADIPGPRWMDDRGCADQRGPEFCSLLSISRRVPDCPSLMQL